MDYQTLLSNPRVRQFLDFISAAEGAPSYNTGFGGKTINDLSKHPGTASTFRQTDGKPNTTTAAGRYQFLLSTWNDLKNKLKLPDFGPRSQDLGAIALIDQKGALADVLSGNFGSAINKLGSTWASLPSSTAAQPKRTWDWAQQQLGVQRLPGAPVAGSVTDAGGAAATPPAVAQAAPVMQPWQQSVAVPDQSSVSSDWADNAFAQAVNTDADMARTAALSQMFGTGDAVSSPAVQLPDAIERAISRMIATI